MMFWFKRQAKEISPNLGPNFLALFSVLQEQAPGTAFTFASTVKRAAPMVRTRGLSVRRKLALIARNLAERDVDRGSRLSLRFCRAVIAAEQNMGMGAVMLASAFRSIEEENGTYRYVQERDKQPPKDEQARRVLNKAGFNCLADLVAAGEIEAQRIGQPMEEFKREMSLSISLFDSREELAQKHVQSTLAAIDALLSAIE